jgi:uncharacterized protein (DUF58 family)
MTRLHNLLRQLRFHLPGHDAGLTQAPLLNQDDILDLMYRVESMHTPAEHFRDVAHSMFGDARSVYRGYGMDYEESRPYQPGDELRFMNWRLTARTGEPYMKVFREERRPGVFILLDRRASMRFGSRVRLKAGQAVRSAAVAAFHAQQQNLPVSGVLLDDELHWVTEAAGRHGAMQFIRAANAPCPPVSYAEEVSLGHTLKLLLALLTKGSRLYLISDFIDLDDSDRPSLLQLCTDHQVYAIQISDPGETHLPALGTLRFCTPGTNTNHDVSVDTSNDANRKNLQQAAHQSIQARQQLFSSLGIDCVQVVTNSQDIETQVPLV